MDFVVRMGLGLFFFSLFWSRCTKASDVFLAVSCFILACTLTLNV